MKISRIAVLWNSSKTGAEACKNAVVKIARERGIDARVSCDFPVKPETLRDCQLCCVVGGDGTILGAVESAVANDVPIFGINLGKLGYLANYAAAEIPRDLDEIFSGNFRLVPHALLECKNLAAGTRFLALNDVVVKSREPFKLTSLRVEAEGQGLLNTFRADGLIFTTSTGSTAYSLGAGGPLIHSEADVFAMTPLCPHTLSNRTIVLPRAMILRVSNQDATTPIAASIDGRVLLPLDAGTLLQIKLSTQKLNILQPKTLSEFEILRTKLKWV